MAKEPPARAPAFGGPLDLPRRIRLTTLAHKRLTLVADTVEGLLEQDNGGVMVCTATDTYGVIGDFAAIERLIWPQRN